MDKFFTPTLNYPKADVNMIGSKFLTVKACLLTLMFSRNFSIAAFITPDPFSSEVLD